MSDTPETNTSAPALQAGDTSSAAGAPATVPAGAAAPDQAAVAPNTDAAANSASDAAATATEAAISQANATATAALAAAAPNLSDSACAATVLGADVNFVDGKPTGVTVTDGVTSATGTSIGEALNAYTAATAAPMNAQTPPPPIDNDHVADGATPFTASEIAANASTGAPPITDEAPPAPTVSLPAVDVPQSIMQKLEAILMPRGGMVEHTVQDLEHVVSWFHAELVKAKTAVADFEGNVAADARVTLAEGRALLAERPDVAAVAVVEGTLHRVGGLVKRIL